MRIKYVVRHSRGKTWAVDELHILGGGLYTKQRIRYFKTEEKAREFKQRKDEVSE